MQIKVNLIVSQQSLRILVLLSFFVSTVTLRFLGTFNAVHYLCIFRHNVSEWIRFFLVSTPLQVKISAFTGRMI